MNLVMFRRSLKELRWPVLWYAVGVVLYGLLILSVYPAVRDNAQTMSQISQAFPKAVMDAFGASDMTSLAGFVGGKFLNVMWPIIAGVFVIMAGAATVAREVERGTIELLLSVPESRTRLFTAKLAALLVGIILLVAATVGSLALGASLVDETLDPGQLLALAVVLTAFAVAVGGYTVLLSSFSKERGRPAGVAAGLTLAFYLAWVISGLNEDWQWLGNVSIFTAFEPQRALADGTFDPWHVAVLSAIGLACTVAALVVFRRRDAISS
jgi:ABC-2 type transport system permease protein